ncbi:SDR family NAD(P)-dependent oxidoreductase [Paractinoplanes lichenicola]|uniref:SDR family oxidoreductase n=1 Tax=Paractinoplanes lichenicola TaxID=2802976 RepID=A0ABS1VEX6_9ACTN|nr:SDR family oxidoreductase [Actinoplanes lichenicola]MBL7253255.1 SDR family oxidoreductase [Actinoplanes lichenicola]
MSRLSGKSGVVTGAAGGIGAAACRAFAAEGAFVGLLDRPGPGLDKLAAELGDRAIALPADVTSEPEVSAAFGTWGRPADFVYVCAGQQLHDVDGPIGDVTLETWDSTIAVNLTGAFLCVKHAIGALCAAPAGSLILCGSPTGLTMSGAGNTAYGASKAGMMALARIVAADYADRNVRANIIVPGTTRTPLIEPLLADDDIHAALLAGAPIGRIGTPDDLIGIAVFLASDESRYATGATFPVDGGLTIR